MWRKFKNWTIFNLALAAIWAAGHLPRALIAPSARVLAALAYRVATRERKRALCQLGLAYGQRLSPRRARLIARGVFYQLALSALELCRVRTGGAWPRVELSPASRAVLDEALALKKGVVFVSGHLGNWELMAAALAAQGYPIASIAKASYDPRFTALIEQFRSARGVLSIYRERPGSAAAMLRTLRANSVFGLLIDQDTNVPCTEVMFFGRAARTPIGAAVLCARTNAPAVVGSIYRGRNRHVIEIERCLLPGDIEAATALLSSRLERRVRERPSQWVWFHNRWRTS